MGQRFQDNDGRKCRLFPPKKVPPGATAPIGAPPVTPLDQPRTYTVTSNSIIQLRQEGSHVKQRLQKMYPILQGKE